MSSKLRKKITKLGLLSTRNKADYFTASELTSSKMEHSLPRFDEGISLGGKVAENRRLEANLKSPNFAEQSPTKETELRQLWDEYKNILIETSNHIIAQDFERQPSSFLNVIKRQNDINERLVNVLRTKEDSEIDFQIPNQRNLSKSTPEMNGKVLTGKLNGVQSPSGNSDFCECTNVPALNALDFQDRSKWEMFKVDDSVDCFVPKSVKTTRKSPLRPKVPKKPESPQSRD